MCEILFATGNSGKVASMARHAKRLGLDLTITQVHLELVEPQADTATQVAQAKVKQAYELLGKPVLVDDSSFHISVLGGFPGPYIKYMLSTIGIEGIIAFMKGKKDRSAYFLSSLIFIDSKGQSHIFEDTPYRGTITKEIDDFNSKTAWSDLYKIFIPLGGKKVLARMTSEDRAAIDEKQLNSYEKFCIWAKDNI